MWGKLLATLGLGSASSSKCDVKIFKMDPRLEVDYEQFLAGVTEQGQWVVAWDDGQYEVVAGQLSLRIGVVSTQQIAKVLSHRWKPSMDTIQGPLPTGMLLQEISQNKYPEPTWVDYLNHGNIQKFVPRVVEQMGLLYAEKPCRALYFEVGTFEEMADACSRAWMWQEISLGPQMHSYRNGEAVWLHFVVMAGTKNALTWVFKLFGNLAIHLRSLSESAAGDGTVIEEFWLEEKETFHKVYKAGDFQAWVDLVFLKCCYKFNVFTSEGEKALLGQLAAGIVEEVGNDGSIEERAHEAFKVFWWIQGTVVRCAETVYKARKIQDHSTEKVLKELAGAVFWASISMSGNPWGSSREPKTEVSRTAMDLLSASANKDELHLTSAVTNLSNHNVTVDADRMVASFGVLCVQKGVACEAPAVTSMILGAKAVDVLCLSEADAMGVQIMTQRKVTMAKSDEDPFGDGDLGEVVLRTAVAGNMAVKMVCELSLSGRSFGSCIVEMWGFTASIFDGTLCFSDSDDEVITGFSVKDGKVVAMTLEGAGGAAGFFVHFEGPSLERGTGPSPEGGTEEGEAKLKREDSEDSLFAGRNFAPMALSDFATWFMALPTA